MDKIYIADDLIEMNLNLDTKEEVITKLSELMLKNNFIKESYIEAVLKREEEFPTALSTENISFAIPHTDPEHVNKAAIAVALLKDKVNFISMEDYGQEIGVKIVFLLAITNPSKQVKVLKKLIEVMQNKEIVEELLNSKDQSKLVKIFQQKLVV